MIRVDNGPEYLSHLLAKWAQKHKITLCHIQPSNPQQNAYVERCNRTVRNEWLGTNIFNSIEEVQNYVTKWLWTYNNPSRDCTAGQWNRPNIGIGGITPAQELNQYQN